MKNKLYSIIRYQRLLEGVKLEHLSEKLSISKSHMSLIERGKRNLSLNDFVNALSFLGCELKILKNGDDCIKNMKLNLVKNELELTDVGYSKNFKNINNENIMVWFNILDKQVFVARDMFDENSYISSEKFNFYEQEHNEDEKTGEFGYGKFYQEYMEEDCLWDLILELNPPSPTSSTH